MTQISVLSLTVRLARLSGIGYIKILSAHYRGIVLSSLLSKFFDTCIISSQFDRLQSNDLQFAYKPQTSTIQCVSSITETVSYFDLTLFSKINTCSTDNDVTYIIMPRIAQESSIYLFPLWSFHNKIAD